jgi:hypothetical protein
LIFVNFYYLVLIEIDKIKRPTVLAHSLDDVEELLLELEFYRDELLSRMEQYLKTQFRKKGISVLQNTYCGFDTEYVPGYSVNELVSVQVACQDRTVVKIPLYHPYDISYVNPLSSEVSDIFINKVNSGGNDKYGFSSSSLDVENVTVEGKELFVHIPSFRELDSYDVDGVAKKKKKVLLNEIFLLNASLKYCIGSIRDFLFGELYVKNRVLIEYMRSLCSKTSFSGSYCYENLARDEFVFVFPLTPMRTGISFPEGKFYTSDLFKLSEDDLKISNFSDFSDRYNFELDNMPSLIKHDIGLEVFRGDGLNDDTIVSSNSESDHELDVESAHEIIGESNYCESNYNESNYNEFDCANDDTNTNTNTNTSANDEHNYQYQQPMKFNDNPETDATYKNKSTTENFIYFIKILNTIGCKTNLKNFYDIYNTSNRKARSRRDFNFTENVKLSLSIVNNFYLISHYNAADIPMLSDFENDLKSKISVVKKSFVTLGLPLKYDDRNMYIRDTILLAPTGYNSLSRIGELYEGEFNKKIISQNDLQNMRDFLKRDKNAFTEYAIQDAVITLKHATAMEVFNMTLKQHGIPMTLSSLGRKYVFEEWSKNFKKNIPYQISGNLLMGNADELQTPKGIFQSKDVGAHMSYFIANYKGGRNESFMYGVDEETM